MTGAQEAGALSGRVAVITGGCSGIGRAIAELYAQHGARIAVNSRSPETAARTAEELVAKGYYALPAPGDVQHRSEAEAIVGAAIRKWGHIDILVNSAGMNLPTRFWKHLTPESFERIVAVNLNGALYCTHAILPAMRARKDGLVINISSWAGRFESYLTGPAYNASKHAMVAMTMSLNDEECVNGIRGCVICPGEVATPILKHRPKPPSPEEIGRMLQAEDLGRTIRFVAEMPAHVCVNEILISPTWNRFFIGGSDIARG